MEGIHLVSAAMAAVEAWDMPAVAKLLADDFTYTGTGRPMNQEKFLAVQSAICEALPDLKFNTSKMRQDGEAAHCTVWATVRITGTHLNDLDLSVIGIPMIPATGIFCQLAPEQIEYSIENGLIVRINAPHSIGSGIPGLMGQIGVEVPYPAK
jgi:hypothetical protein